MLNNVLRPLTTFVVQIGAVIVLAFGLNGCTQPTKAAGSKNAEVPTATDPQSPATPENKTQPTAAVNMPKIDIATASTSPIADQAVIKKTLATNSPKQPFKIFISIDRTGSTVSSKIPSLQFSQLERLARAAAKVGAEIRLGVICTDSDLPLLAFFVPEPLVAPEQLPPAPTSASVDNMLKLPKLRADYQKIVAAYQQAEAEYQQKVAAREQLIETEIANLKRGFELLQNKPECGATDIYGMLKRADLYLNEVNPTWTQTPRKLALLVTDGIETVNTTKPQPFEWTNKSEVVLVSSGAEVGILKPLLKNAPYESIDGAIRYIIAR